MKKNEIEIPGKTFTEFFRAISLVISECKLHIDDGVLHVKAVDTANVELIDIEADVWKGLDAQARPKTNGKSSVVLGIDIEKLRRITKIIQPTETIKMSWERGNSDIYKVTFETKNYSTTMVSLNVGTIRKEPNPPKISMTAKFTVNISSIANFLTVANEKCRFIVSNNCVKLATEFDEPGEKSVMKLCKGTGSAVALFSSDYLSDITKSFPNQMATVELADDRPIDITLTAGQINVRWMLAPRVEAD